MSEENKIIKKERGRFLIALKRSIHYVFWLYAYVLSFLRAVVEVAVDVISHWLSTGMDSIAPTFIKKQHVLKGMTHSTSYKEWKHFALELDRIEGNQVIFVFVASLTPNRHGKCDTSARTTITTLCAIAWRIYTESELPMCP